MKPKSILITGGAGFIGSEFVRQIFTQGYYSKIYVLDKLTYASDLRRIENELKDKSVELLEFDVNQTNKYISVLPECAEIVHFAAESHVDRSIAEGFPFLNTNIVGTYNLLEAVRIHSTARTLLVSTDEVYGSIEKLEASEDFNLDPSSIYSASKASADIIGVANYKTHNQDLVISRCCNNYGPFQNSEKFIPLAIDNLISGKNVPVYGDGLNVREWIHISDHVSALLLIMNLGKPGSIYNIGTSDRFSNLELLRLILSELQLDESRIDFVKDRLGHDKRYALNSSKISKELGWKPKIDFKSGIAETVRWHIANNSNMGGEIA